MMSIIKYPGVDHHSRSCRGITLVCNFGYQHLACKPEHKPDDEWLGLPLMDFWTCKTLAKQFLSDLHQWRNDSDVMGRIFSYLKNDEHSQANYNQQQIAAFIALQLEQRQLLIFPLAHKKALFSNHILKATTNKSAKPVVLESGNKLVKAKTSITPDVAPKIIEVDSLNNGKQHAVQYWQNIEKNADSFPKAFGARLMKLNAEAGYGIAEGVKSTYETLTSWDKFSAAAEGLAHTVTHPKETFNAIQDAAELFADLPVGEQGEAAYKALVGGLASAGLGKIAINAGKLGKLTPTNTKFPAGLHNQAWNEVYVPEGKFKTIRKVDMDNLSDAEQLAAKTLDNQGWEPKQIKEVLSSGDNFRVKELNVGDKLYGIGTEGFEKNIKTSAYWLDEAGYQEIQSKFLNGGVLDKDGVKNHLALPCFNRVNSLDVVELTKKSTVVESTIGKASELIQYTDDSGYSTGLLGKIMPGGGTQITPDPSTLVKFIGK